VEGYFKLGLRIGESGKRQRRIGSYLPRQKRVVPRAEADGKRLHHLTRRRRVLDPLTQLGEQVPDGELCGRPWSRQFLRLKIQTSEFV
jgi:hypothetical protein